MITQLVEDPRPSTPQCEAEVSMDGYNAYYIERRRAKAERKGWKPDGCTSQSKCLSYILEQCETCSACGH